MSDHFQDYHRIQEHLAQPGARWVNPTRPERWNDPGELEGEPHQFLWRFTCRQAMICATAAVQDAYAWYAQEVPGHDLARHATVQAVLALAGETIVRGPAPDLEERWKALAQKGIHLTIGLPTNSPVQLMLYSARWLTDAFRDWANGTESVVLRRMQQEGFPVHCFQDFGRAASEALASIAGHSIDTYSPGQTAINPAHQRVIDRWWADCRARPTFTETVGARVVGGDPLDPILRRLRELTDIWEFGGDINRPDGWAVEAGGVCWHLIVEAWGPECVEDVCDWETPAPRQAAVALQRARELADEWSASGRWDRVGVWEYLDNFSDLVTPWAVTWAIRAADAAHCREWDDEDTLTVGTASRRIR